MDATYWAMDKGLLVIKDAHRGDVLWRKFLSKKETVADYMEVVHSLCSNGYTIIGVVADGLRGLRQALGNIPFQYCQFHAIRFVRIQLTTRPKTIPGQQLSAIANGMAHTDKESFEGALSQWFEQWHDYVNERTKSENGRLSYTHRRLRTAALSLKRNMDVLWTFYTRSELGLPNTNNALESFFAMLKKLVGVHNGLNAQHKRTMIDAYISVYNAHKQRTQGALYVQKMSITTILILFQVQEMSISPRIAFVIGQYRKRKEKEKSHIFGLRILLIGKFIKTQPLKSQKKYTWRLNKQEKKIYR